MFSLDLSWTKTFIGLKCEQPTWILLGWNKPSPQEDIPSENTFGLYWVNCHIWEKTTNNIWASWRRHNAWQVFISVHVMTCFQQCQPGLVDHRLRWQFLFPLTHRNDACQVSNGMGHAQHASSASLPPLHPEIKECLCAASDDLRMHTDTLHWTVIRQKKRLRFLLNYD